MITEYDNVNVPEKPKNYLALSIITTLLCCMPLGVVGIINATQVDNLYNSGKYDEAIKKAKTAKTMSLIGLISGFVFIFLYIILVIVAGVASEM